MLTLSVNRTKCSWVNQDNADEVPCLRTQHIYSDQSGAQTSNHNLMVSEPCTGINAFSSIGILIC